jgi:serine/threonine protein kinase
VSTDIALPRGYALNEYRIESTLGIGGFGLTYLATDGNLNLKVAIKEYLPADLVVRCEDQSVKSKSEASLETFNWGRTRFLEESRTIASFRHPNIVRVMRFFEANQTAYMVMEFVAGDALSDWIKPRRPLGEQALLDIVLPLLEGLDVVHRAGYLHRDIKPANIFIRRDGSPVLIDFGSARAVATDTELTSIVSPGFAPFEQYHSRGGQGPWSDLYALGGVLYWIVTGEKPVEAPARAFNDPMTPALKAGEPSRYSAQLLKTIDWALAPSKEARPQSVDEWRNALRSSAPKATADQPTIFIPKQPAATPSAAIDGATLGSIATALAAHVGPIASKLVQSEARKGATLTQLIEKIAAEIPDATTRAAFVKKFSAEQRASPSGKPAGATQPPSQPTQVTSAPQPFDAATLSRAENELAKFIGAVAKVVVKRAASKARSESELYALLAEQIDDKNDRKSFVRKAMSISGRE